MLIIEIDRDDRDTGCADSPTDDLQMAAGMQINVVAKEANIAARIWGHRHWSWRLITCKLQRRQRGRSRFGQFRQFQSTHALRQNDNLVSKATTADCLNAHSGKSLTRWGNTRYQ